MTHLAQHLQYVHLCGIKTFENNWNCRSDFSLRRSINWRLEKWKYTEKQSFYTTKFSCKKNSPISKSLATGLPGKTLDSCDTVLLTVEYNLLITSMVPKTFRICTRTKKIRFLIILRIFIPQMFFLLPRCAIILFWFIPFYLMTVKQNVKSDIWKLLKHTYVNCFTLKYHHICFTWIFKRWRSNTKPYSIQFDNANLLP